MSIQRTAIFYIILILGEFSNVTFQEVMAPATLTNGIPSPDEKLSSVNGDSRNLSGNNVNTGHKEQLSQVILQINGSVKEPCVSTTDNENCDNSKMVLASAITDVKNCSEPMNNSNWEKFKSIWNKFTLWGAVAGAVVFSPVMILPQCLGFGSSGIEAMSCAARMMSRSAIANGGGIVVGSLVAILQSIGALGVCSLGLIPIGIIIFIGAAFGFGIGYVVKMVLDWLYPENINGLNDTASFDLNCKTIAQTNSGNSNLINNFTFDSEMNVTPTTNELLATNLSSTHDEAIDSGNHTSLSVNLTTSFGAEIENGTFRLDNGLPTGDGSHTWDLIKTLSVNTWSDVRNGTENAWSAVVDWTKGENVGSNACLSSSQPSVLLLSLVIYFLMTGSR